MMASVLLRCTALDRCLRKKFAGFLVLLGSPTRPRMSAVGEVAPGREAKFGIGEHRDDMYWPYVQSPHRRVRGRHVLPRWV